MTTLQIGKANYTANKGEKLTYYRLGMKDNQRELVLRIAPPIKDLAEKGFAAVYHKQHFGYSVTGKGDKRIPQTFNCIERKDRNKNIVQSCPECNEIALRKEAIATKEKSLSANNTPPEVIEAQLRPQKAWLKEHNCDRKWTLLAKNESGTWGYLAISNTCYEDLTREIKELATMGFEDPFGVDHGVWFRFSRTGTAFNDITDKVTAVKVNLGKGAFGIKEDALTQTDFAALEALPNLSQMGRKLTYEQIAMLVESGGDEEVVKSVFQSASSARSETSAVRSTSPTTLVDTEKPTEKLTEKVDAAPAKEAAKEAPQKGEDLHAQLAALQAKLAAMNLTEAVLTEAVQTAKAAAPKATQPTISPELSKNLDMDVDDFVKTFGEE